MQPTVESTELCSFDCFTHTRFIRRVLELVAPRVCCRSSDSVEWAASYELKVDLDLAVAYKGIKPTAALCYFKLTHASDLDALPMDVDLRVPTTTKVGQGITPVDSAAYKAAQQLLTEAAMNVRTAMG